MTTLPDVPAILSSSTSSSFICSLMMMMMMMMTKWHGHPVELTFHNLEWLLGLKLQLQLMTHRKLEVEVEWSQWRRLPLFCSVVMHMILSVLSFNGVNFITSASFRCVVIQWLCIWVWASLHHRSNSKAFYQNIRRYYCRSL